MERNFPVVIEQDEETGKFVVTCPILQGCYTQGDTLQDAMDNIREAIVLCLEDIPHDERPKTDKVMLGNVVVNL